MMGLASTLVRYLKKIVHRLSVDSPQFYDISFWIQVVAVFYLAHVFLTYWEFGLIQSYGFLKVMLLAANTVLICLVKVIFIERAQNHIIRDLAIVNMLYFSFILCYGISGYPWTTFVCYLSIIMHKIIAVNLLDQLSPHLHSSIGLVFNDPENLDELVRLNIKDQLEGTLV